MKILFVCENYYPHYGGAEVLFKNLAEGFVKEGHRVAIVTTLLPGTKRSEEINGVKVHRVSCFNNRYLFSFLSIPKVLRLARRADLIQTTTFNGAPPAWLSAKIAKRPVVLTVHEVWVGKWKEVTDFTGMKAAMHDLLERTLYLLPFDRYVCVSNATKKDLLQLGINPEKAATIYNGFDYDFWKVKNFSAAAAQKMRKDLDLKKRFVCLSWGRPGSSKGFEYLIRAAPYLQKKIPNVVILLMLGSKEKYQQNYHKIKGLADQHQDLVKIIPSVPYQQLGNIIRAADCVIIPSLSEGFGYNVLEASSLGVPVVVSNAGSLPEIVSGKHQIFRSKDSLDLAEKVHLVAGKKLNDRPPQKFEWPTTISQYLDIYQTQIKE
ncbi:MAG: glycosyltransferase family 4 protein [Nanoarchaeota archaeon]|nr:glycosyltransferase family 4 protein [Nanoarchaeota archaeon]